MVMVMVLANHLMGFSILLTMVFFNSTTVWIELLKWDGIGGISLPSISMKQSSKKTQLISSKGEGDRRSINFFGYIVALREKMVVGECWSTMDLLRLEPMQLVQLIKPVESAYCAISHFGDLGLFQFKDLNAEKSPYQRIYAAQIKRCGEVDRKLHFFKEKIIKAGLSPSTRSSGSVDLDLNSLEKAGEFFTSAQNRAAAQLRELEGRHNGEGSIDSPLLLEQEMITESSNHVKLGYVSGLVPREKSMAFERILFCATRGNVFLK